MKIPLFYWKAETNVLANLSFQHSILKSRFPNTVFVRLLSVRWKRIGFRSFQGGVFLSVLHLERVFVVNAHFQEACCWRCKDLSQLYFFSDSRGLKVKLLCRW